MVLVFLRLKECPNVLFLWEMFDKLKTSQITATTTNFHNTKPGQNTQNIHTSRRATKSKELMRLFCKTRTIAIEWIAY